ncbi:MAG: hypothetical protein ACT4PP_16775 [Sporichthyaceae bacterium]
MSRPPRLARRADAAVSLLAVLLLAMFALLSVIVEPAAIAEPLTGVSTP